MIIQPPSLYVPQNFGLDILIDPLNLDGNYTYYSDGVSISSIIDQGITPNNMSQATGAAQPIYKRAIINGNPVLRFSGAQWMSSPNGVNNAYAGAMSIFCVFATPNNSPASTGRIITKISSWGLSYASTNATFSFTGPYTATGLIAANNTFYNIGAFYDGSANTTFYRNGALFQNVALAAVMPASSSDLYLGSRDGLTNFIECDIAFLAVKFGTLSNFQINAINFYLNQRFGLS
jgi:hypothetical protein